MAKQPTDQMSLAVVTLLSSTTWRMDGNEDANSSTRLSAGRRKTGVACCAAQVKGGTGPNHTLGHAARVQPHWQPHTPAGRGIADTFGTIFRYPRRQVQAAGAACPCCACATTATSTHVHQAHERAGPPRVPSNRVCPQGLLPAPAAHPPPAPPAVAVLREGRRGQGWEQH